MKYLKWIAVAALIGSTTACIDNSPYGSGYGRPYVSNYGYSSGYEGYGYGNGQNPSVYNQQQTYYGQRPANNYYVVPQQRSQVREQSRYGTAPATRSSRGWENDNEGVQDRPGQDRNHTGAPDARDHN